MPMIWLAAVLSSASVAIWQWPLERRPPSPDDTEARDPDEEPSLTLVLEMIAVAVRQGASIPHALEAVGDIISGEFGRGLAHAGRALNRGADWHGAWSVLCDEGRTAASFRVLSDALEPSWRHGSSPLIRLETAIEQLDKDERSAIEQSAARLSVRLLIPTGLCFLPAFLFVGVIPGIASFVM